MKFETPSEVLRYYAAIVDIGTSGSSMNYSDQIDGEEVLLANEYDSGLSDPMAWANIVHEKVDIENALKRIFNNDGHKKRRSWVIRLLMHWAVDGYNETIDNIMGKFSQVHAGMGRSAREQLLNGFIGEITDEFIRIGYLKKHTNPFKGLPFYSEAYK